MRWPATCPPVPPPPAPSRLIPSIPGSQAHSPPWLRQEVAHTPAWEPTTARNREPTTGGRGVTRGGCHPPSHGSTPAALGQWNWHVSSFRFGPYACLTEARSNRMAAHQTKPPCTLLLCLLLVSGNAPCAISRSPAMTCPGCWAGAVRVPPPAGAKGRRKGGWRVSHNYLVAPPCLHHCSGFGNCGQT